MAEEHPEPEPEEPDEIEELPELDYADPLKRDVDEDLPGLDPVITLPPE
jgi:hypothetical protein